MGLSAVKSFPLEGILFSRQLTSHQGWGPLIKVKRTRPIAVNRLYEQWADVSIKPSVPGKYSFVVRKIPLL